MSEPLLRDNAPLLTTERLELWRPQPGDEPQMFAIMQDPRTWRYFGATPSRVDHVTRFMRNAGSWQLHGYGSFMVRSRGEEPVVGNCGVFHTWRGLGEDFDDKPEAGWIVAADHAGKGYAREAMDAALAWFDATHGPREVVCIIHPDNAPSNKLAGRLGFEPTRLTELAPDNPVQVFSRVANSPVRT
ncbi:Acetyltransferase (GNAT) family protein [Tsuneonella dongtanensis]|uniref:Acetyltransferase (GNAT) family protein n=1 Tax=Tsuneonella dongtanensis TaxID=692370 RepID=A0A1B2AAI0_9SPHN|nr:GNAT family N-acetyltransferase [Tsuneonella dongtanensis]ANY19170.1 Acetyltransferase (GNAT) family protein [Tsuneonella dongtanensis]